MIQIRDKGASPRELFDEVEQITASAPADVRLIVNDRVDIARVTGAAGAHVGQRDLPPAAARLVLGPDGIVGFSTHNVEQALEADKLPVDYIAVGPIFPTSTKENPDPVLSLKGLVRICEVVLQA